MSTYTIVVEGHGTFRNIPSWDRSGGYVSFVDPTTGLRHIFSEGCAVHSFQQVSEPAGGGLTIEGAFQRILRNVVMIRRWECVGNPGHTPEKHSPLVCEALDRIERIIKEVGSK